MKKHRVHILVVVTILFAAFICGLYIGRNYGKSEITVLVSPAMQTLPAETTAPMQAPTEETIGITFPIDINQAGKEEFMELPGIGDVLAQRILNYREDNGPFQSVEELLNVTGIGKKRMENILELITIGG